jgi:hypothetical protein
MEIRVGDRFTDEQGEWEVDTHPSALHRGKSLHSDALNREVTYGWHCSRGLGTGAEEGGVVG